MTVEHRHDAHAGASGHDAPGQWQLTAILNRAQQWHGAGRFDDAARDYLAVLAKAPDHPQALHLYGVLQFQRGAADHAEALLRQSIAIAPDVRALSDLGAIAGERGRTDEALAHFAAALRASPDDVQTLVRRGNTLTNLRRHDDALASFDRALAVSPLVLDALCNRGGALRALGRFDEALDTYDRALMVDPHSFESWFNRGLVLREMRRAADALHCFDRANAIRPGVAAIVAERGRTLADLDRLNEALAAFDEAIAADPARLDALCDSAAVLERLGRADEALARCDRVLAHDPADARALASRGNALLQLERHDEALDSYARALAIEPRSADTLCNRGTALRHLQRFDAALASYDDALALDSRFAEAWTNRSRVLQDLHRYDEAFASLDRALALRPDHAASWLARGNLFADRAQAADAFAAYDRALALQPDWAGAHCARASLHLMEGDFARGWHGYEWRLRDPQFARYARSFTQPAWRGDEPLDGRTILIHAEPDFDDTLQFCRYVPHVAARGARVVLEVPPSLHTLMASLAGTAHVISRGAPLPAFDCHVPLPSLPYAFRTETDTIPRDAAYLHADPQRTREWDTLLGERRRPRIGLAWAGDPAQRHDAGRSIDFARLTPLFDLDVDWISLQKPVHEHDDTRLADTPVRRVDDELGDFADMAALIGALDLVIAADSAVAHLAGALGARVWVLLPDPPAWRWMRTRGDSPWYPSARLFRQPAPGDWADAIGAVRAALEPMTR
ncbi:tetratricopeptide repeat protein [Burkholderia stabilis]|uniref:TPR repeat-containing protein yrrB,lipoprotein NlpI,Predicted O-linked N-acetylglucosamine transferase, SPINDLY family,putative PEP-CTERM system TPR-repeat lipoprotein,Tetratricopeptide repeat n=1 Tax=Burkholderia stabilis TaxID=95485 RepID=A0AAJ5NGF9_9BURK|nr:tetratricopeptide repeat protein [Burkholderia stabilis]VBB14375.1 TPR repeat-containing protein yrrB,lipoprotein NlpI,Predicted O-linked N-acetylglucosamine transferase, SPINDLY family,putative PEP-CTERM system TPR-repeat lipoprotein,Tetratricopeptide repeat [Burkholderia stabilis]